MRLRVLTETDCRSMLTMKEAIGIQADAFLMLAEGRSVDGLRSVVTSATPPGIVIFNPSYLRDRGGFGVKVVSDFYDNPSRGAPRMTALLALMDGETGAPRTVMEAGYLTDLRTGAGTALAASHLARSDSRVLAVIGAGRVARNQVEGITAALNIDTILVATRTRSRGERFVAAVRTLDDTESSNVHLLDSVQEAVQAADIVVAATTSHEPVVRGEWLKPGTFVASVGSAQTPARELDDETIRRASQWTIDSRADCLERAGDFIIPISEGILDRERVTELAEVISGASPGRSSPDQITVYKSLGVPIQDIVTGQHIERRARESGAGIEIDIGGDHD